jgi:hypothetical protein
MLRLLGIHLCSCNHSVQAGCAEVALIPP